MRVAPAPWFGRRSGICSGESREASTECLAPSAEGWEPRGDRSADYADYTDSTERRAPRAESREPSAEREKPRTTSRERRAASRDRVIRHPGSLALRKNQSAHVDTVPPGDPAPWQTDPLVPVEKDSVIYGRGAMDAKGCLASLIVAFESLAQREDTLPGRVILMAVGAEERGGLGTKAEVAKGLKAEAAIIGESTGLIPMIAHKGAVPTARRDRCEIADRGRDGTRLL